MSKLKFTKGDAFRAHMTGNLKEPGSSTSAFSAKGNGPNRKQASQGLHLLLSGGFPLVVEGFGFLFDFFELHDEFE